VDLSGDESPAFTTAASMYVSILSRIHVTLDVPEMERAAAHGELEETFFFLIDLILIPLFHRNDAPAPDEWVLFL
jgi:hypothetical protein